MVKSISCNCKIILTIILLILQYVSLGLASTLISRNSSDISKNEEKSGIAKPLDGKQLFCNSNLDCSGSNPYCNIALGLCVSCSGGQVWDGTRCRDDCDLGEIWDPDDKECKDIGWDDVDDGVKVAVGVIIALAICIPLIIIIAIIACCFCCAGCAGHAYRQRKNKKNQQQPNATVANTGHNHYSNQAQDQYSAPPPNYGKFQNPSANLQGDPTGYGFDYGHGNYGNNRSAPDPYSSNQHRRQY